MTRAQIVERAKAYIGTPFERLPGEPSDHKIVGELSDGRKVPAGAVEMVYNDWKFIDYVYGEGFYQQLNQRDPDLLAIFELAKQLYQQEGVQEGLAT